MADVTIQSHLGGLNEDPEESLRDDELVQADNIEFWQSKLGARRLGCTAISLTSSSLTNKDTICFLSQWFPTNVPTLSEWVAASVTLAGSIQFARRDTAGTWHTITASDTVDFTALAFHMTGTPFKGHFHWAYKSDQNRSHILLTDGTMSRSSFSTPSPPTAADSGTNGIFAGTRYYRIRVVEISGSTVLRRSEPSTVLTFTPAKTKNAAVVTKPTLPGEGETHWEIECSLDNANWYRMSQIVVATTTFTDTTAGPKLFPAVVAGAPTATDGSGVVYTLLSNQAAQLNLTGTVSNGTYGNPAGTAIAARGWIGYDGAAAYITQAVMGVSSFVWTSVQNWYASPDVATALESACVGGTGQDYAAAGTLSEAVGAYLALPSFKFSIVDGDRLIYGSDQSDASFFSRVGWTPAGSDPGVGNDERAPIVTTAGTPITTTKQLDNYTGGGLTGLASGIQGSWFAFKYQGIYAAQRTRDNTNAYEIELLTRERGAIEGSIINAVDSHGNPVVFFLDPNVGPCMLTAGGVIKVLRGQDDTWPRVSKLASSVVVSGCFYPLKHQVLWAVAVDSGIAPSLGIRVDTDLLREDDEGYLRGGISHFDGVMAGAYCMASLLYTAGTLTTTKPFVGATTPHYLLETDSAGVYKDNGVSYRATVVGKPRYTAGLTKLWQASKAGLLSTANAAGSVAFGLVRDQNASEDATIMSEPFSLAPRNSEPQVLSVQTDVNSTEATSIQLKITDGIADSPWSTQRVDFRPMEGGEA